ncbi:MAG: hypothetical protein AAFU41_15755 [Pseudomonadota bacterium]
MVFPLLAFGLAAKLQQNKKGHALVKLFCVLVAIVGLAQMGGSAPSLYDGVRLWQSGTAAEVTVIGKEIDRPTRRTGIRAETVNVNGTEVRSLRTYFNHYFLNVSYVRDGAAVQALAPVSYSQFQTQQTGVSITAMVHPLVETYVDASARNTLLYALHRMAIGLLILVVGLIAYRLPDEG